MFLKKWNTDVVNWDELIDTYNTAIENGDAIKVRLPGFFVCHNAHLIKKVQNSMKIVGACDAHAYFNISIQGKTFGWHRDDVDVYYWQCIGKVKIFIEDEEFLLEPGDMVKIPKGVEHNVIPLTPRLGISMSNKPTKEQIENFRKIVQGI
jgi:mannose-6-phosphate isomerase-like protein (cupin superfamily)